MKLAIPVKTNKENPAISPLFGKAKWFAFVNIDGKIEIKNHFLIPANQKELSFPLIFGEENINFEAYITSIDLPLKKPVECELKLEYNYEDETPYKLTFIAIDNSIKPLKVGWREIKEKEYISLVKKRGYNNIKAFGLVFDGKRCWFRNSE